MGFPASVFDGSATPAPLISSPTLPHCPDLPASEQSGRRLVAVALGGGHNAGWPVCVPGGDELVSTSASSSVAISGPASDTTHVRSAPLGGATGAAAATPASFAAPPTVPASDVHPAAPSAQRPLVTARVEVTEAADALSPGDPLIGASVPADAKGAAGVPHQRQ